MNPHIFKDARDDIGGAEAIGIKGFLVQTGQLTECFLLVFWFEKKSSFWKNVELTPRTIIIILKNMT